VFSHGRKSFLFWPAEFHGQTHTFRVRRAGVLPISLSSMEMAAMVTWAEESWHCFGLEEITQRLETDLSRGLIEDQVSLRLETFGTNTLTRKKGQGPITRFLLQFNQPLVIILLVATLVTLFLHEWVEAGVIFAVILINAFVGFIPGIQGSQSHRLPSPRDGEQRHGLEGRGSAKGLRRGAGARRPRPSPVRR
jgi:magnesium-transporting ATPase (P-type)